MSIPRSLLVKWANKSFDLLSLLEEAGVHNPKIGGLIYCPFHDDESGGKRSGKIHPDALHCFSESRQYRQYDILRHLGYPDSQIETTLRSMGEPPDELFQYEEVRVDIRSPLSGMKAQFMSGTIQFNQYLTEVMNGITDLVKNSKKAI